MDIGELAAILRQRPAEVAEALLGKPTVRTRREWRWGRKGSLSVVVGGPKAGSWFSHEDGIGGDMLALVERELGRDRGLEWARRRFVGADPSPVPIQRRDKPELEVDAEAIKRQGRASDLAAKSVPISGTPGEFYLRNRGINPGTWPDCIRWRHRTWGGIGPDGQHIAGGAVVVVATDSASKVKATQSIHVTAEGQKAPADLCHGVVKRTAGTLSGAAVRLPGATPIILAEGPETALSIWYATGRETWAVLGVSNFASADIPSGDTVVIAKDADQPGAASHHAIDRAAEALGGRGVKVLVAKPVLAGFDKADFNDVLLAEGQAAVVAMIEAALPWEAPAGDACLPYFDGARLLADEAAALLLSTFTDFLQRADRALRMREEINAAVLAAEEDSDRMADMVIAAGGHGANPRARYREICAAAKLRAKADPTKDELEGVDDRVRRVLGRRSAREAEGEVRRRWATSNEGYPFPPRLEVKATAGLGKTSNLGVLLNSDTKWLEGRRTHLFADRHALIDKLCEAYPTARVIKGRAQHNADGSRMCKRWRAADAIRHGFLRVLGNLCDNGYTRCPHYAECPWIAQWQDHRPGIVIMPSSYLAIHKPCGFPPPDLAVVDESAIGALVLEPFSVSPANIRQSRLIGGLGASVQHRKTGLAVLEALEQPGSELRALRERGITADAVRGAAKWLTEAAGGGPAISPTMADAEIIRRMDNWRAAELHKIAVMFEALADEIGLQREGAHGVAMRPTKVYVGKAGATAEIQDRIHVFRAATAVLPAEGALLLLDADANKLVNERLFGGMLESVEIRARRNSEVIQVMSTKLTETELTAQSETGERKRRQLRDLFAREARGGKKVLVVTYLDLRCELTGENRGDKLPVSCRYGDVDIAHFGNVRGYDDFKSYDTVIVVGRFQAPPQAYEDIARAIYAADPEPLKFLGGDAGSGGWKKERRGYAVKSGAASVDVDVHPDPRVQALVEIGREAETAQAIDRLRLVFRDFPGRVLLLSSLVVDVEVDKLATWAEIAAGDDPIEVALDRQDGILPLSAAWLHGTMPDIFTSERSAERAAAEVINRQKRNKESYIADLAVYRLQGQRKPSKALVTGDMREIAGRLAAKRKSWIASMEVGDEFFAWDISPYPARLGPMTAEESQRFGEAWQNGTMLEFSRWFRSPRPANVVIDREGRRWFGRPGRASEFAPETMRVADADPGVDISAWPWPKASATVATPVVEFVIGERPVA